MIWYVAIFFICFIAMVMEFGIKEVQKKKIIWMITVLILAFFSGTRYKLGGWDYGIYHNIFQLAPKISNFTLSITNPYGTEIGYILLNSVVKSVGFNFYGFTLIHSLIFYFLLYKAIRKFDISFGFFIIVFLYKIFIFNTFVSMRQSLVLVIFFNAVYYLINGQKTKYLMLLIPCVFLHTSSLILFPLVFIDKIIFTKRSLIFYAGVFLFFFVLNFFNIYKFDITNIIYGIVNNASLSDKIAFYGSSETTINILSTIEVYLITFFVIFNFDTIYIKRNSKERQMMCNLFFLAIPIVTLFRSTEVMVRFRDYFMLFEPFVLYYCMLCLSQNNKLIYLFAVTLICFFGLYRYVYMYDEGEYALKNYQSYIVKDISIWGSE